MPWMRYFFFAGAALLALLFISDAYSTKEAVANGSTASAERPMLRIQSDQRWPERIVMDTSQPAISPPQAVLPVVAAAPKAVADIDTTTAPMEAYTQVSTIEPKKAERKIVRKQRVARVHRHPATERQPAMASAQLPGFDLFAWR